MKLRFGIVGLGIISNRFASVLNTVKGVQLTAVASREQSRSDAFAHKYGAKKAYANYLDLIQDEEIEAVYIGLTHNFHFEIAQICLEHHKAVLCEKPLVTSKEDAVKLAQIARINKTLLMEALWTRCLPSFQAAKKWAKERKIGEIQLITANFCRRTDYDPESRLFNPRLAGGSLLDLGVYPIGFTTGILDEPPQSVAGYAKFAPSGVDEAVAITMTFASGALANLSCGFNVTALRDAYIYGTNGYIHLDDCVAPHVCELYDEDNNLLERVEDVVLDGFVYQIQHFLSLYQNQKLESDLIPLKDSITIAGIFDDLQGQWGK